MTMKTNADFQISLNNMSPSEEPTVTSSASLSERGRFRFSFINEGKSLYKS